MRISIKEICGKNTVTRNDGMKVHQMILNAWPDNDIIEIDFGNIIIASVSFMDQTIGLLANKYTREELKTKIKLLNITHEDRALINDILRSRYTHIRLEKSAQFLN